MYNRIEEIQSEFKDRLEAAKPIRPTKPHLGSKHTSAEVLEYAGKLTEYEAKLVEYSKQETIYEGIRVEMNNKIEEEIKEETGLNWIVPEQYRDKVWSKAWSDGHSSGYGQVYSCLNSLVEIFEEQ